MCWMPLLTESVAWRLYPAHELMSKGSLFPLLELWISSLCLSSGLQVVGLTGAGSLGSFCGQCSLLIRGQGSPWRGFYLLVFSFAARSAHWTALSCFLLVAVCCKESNRQQWESRISPSLSAWSHHIMFNIQMLSWLLLTLDVTASGNWWAFIWLFLSSEYQNAATNSYLAL